jgi:SAM-dependent methyltransferase
MSGFSADWLTLREPYDTAARNGDVLAAVVTAMSRQSSIRVADLACGTGSTLRAIAPQLAARQHWRLADNDLGLLGKAAATALPVGCAVTPMPVDLARDLEAALDGPLDLVTTSALLDLVSADWLERLVVEIGARRLPFYAALSYDGRIAFDPPAPLDGELVGAVNLHQHGDKGFGPALGPDAAEAAIARFTAIGYRITQGPSDWRFGPADAVIQDALLRGWTSAAQEARPLRAAAFSTWLDGRRGLLAAGRSAATVGHIDFFAVPADA